MLGNAVADRVCSILHETDDNKGLASIDRIGHSDHSHLFARSPSKHSPALLADWFEAISSRKYNHRSVDHDGERVRWARGYYAGTAGHVSSETVQEDRQRQEADA